MKKKKMVKAFIDYAAKKRASKPTEKSKVVKMPYAKKYPDEAYAILMILEYTGMSSTECEDFLTDVANATAVMNKVSV